MCAYTYYLGPVNNLPVNWKEENIISGATGKMGRRAGCNLSRALTITCAMCIYWNSSTQNWKTFWTFSTITQPLEGRKKKSKMHLFWNETKVQQGSLCPESRPPMEIRIVLNTKENFKVWKQFVPHRLLLFEFWIVRKWCTSVDCSGYLRWPTQGFCHMFISHS